MKNKKNIAVYLGIIILLLIGCKESPNEPGDNTQLPDSTSQNFIWERNSSVGLYNDAWGSSSDNIYFVGHIYPDSHHQYGTNIMHWNGQEYKQLNILEGILNGIYGFDKNSIWTVGYYENSALVMNWNGNEWKSLKLEQYSGLTDIWGSSPTNIFAVGYNGTILKYNGNQWLKMDSQTDLSLFKIWGTNSNNIYATGYDSRSGKGVLLHFNGQSWLKIFDNNINDNPPSGMMYAIWGYDSTFYLIAGSGRYTGQMYEWSEIELPNETTGINEVKGNNQKDIFMVGYFGLMMHWNGKRWKLFNNFDSTIDFRNVFPIGDEVFGLGNYIYRGVRIN